MKYFKILLIIIIILIIYNLIDIEYFGPNEPPEKIVTGYISKSNSVSINNLQVTGSFNLMPRGTIVMFNSDKIPAGWTICNGLNGTPDLTERFVLGWKKNGEQIGSKGGEENVTLNINQIPAHYHEWYFGCGRGRNATGVKDGNTTRNTKYSVMTRGGGGGGRPHNNMPPYYVLNYIMRIA